MRAEAREAQHPREAFRELARPLQHPEGLCWDPLTERIYCGGEGGQVYAVELDGEITEVANTGGSILGMAVDGRGLVYACDWHKDQVLRVDPTSGRWDVYTSGASDLRIDDPNSVVFADDGTMYVTGSENPAIFRVRPGGETTVWSRDARGYPNGVALSPAGDLLYVAESHPIGGDGGKVWKIPIADDGEAGPAELVAELWHTVPDGMAFDSEGGLLVAHYTPDRIDRIVPTGDVEILVEDWEAVYLNAPTNVAFCGPDLSWLAVACVGEEFLALADALGLRGMPLRYPML